MDDLAEGRKHSGGQEQDGNSIIPRRKSRRSDQEEDEEVDYVEGKSSSAELAEASDRNDAGVAAAATNRRRDGGDELQQSEEETSEITEDKSLEDSEVNEAAAAVEPTLQNPIEDLSFKSWEVDRAADSAKAAIDAVAAAAIDAVATVSSHDGVKEFEPPEGTLLSSATPSEEEPTQNIFLKGWSSQHSPQRKSLVNPGEPTEENFSGGEAGPKIEYFCPPNQVLTSDAWKILFYHMLPFTTVPHFLILSCLLWAYHQWGWTALLFYTTMCALLTFSTPIYSKRFRAAVSDYFYGLLARYVPSAQYVVPEKPFPEKRPYIFACHPHGRMFYSTIIFSQRHSIWRKTILQSGDLFMTAAGQFFSVPFVRNLFYLVGAIPAGKKDIIAKLRNKDHVTILVGGVKEVLLGTEDDADMIYLKKRKGFCKIAIQENAGVVPVYFFNENQMFNHNSKSFLRFWERVNKHVKVGVPFMRGRFFILPMPFRRPLLIAVGEPLFVKEGESLDAFHGRYMKALRDLFDKYVPYSPKPDHKLIVV